MKSEQLLEVLPGNVQITSLMTSPNGELLLTGNMTGMIHAWAIDQEKQSAPVVVGTQSAPHPLLKGARDIALASERRLLFSTGANPQLNDVIAWKMTRRLTRAYTLTGRETQPGALATQSG